MANADAFDSGFDQGIGSSKKRTGKKKKTGGYDSDDAYSQPQQKKNPWSILSYLPKLKRGGKIARTGLAVLHKNEYVVPAKHRSRKRAEYKKTVIKA